MSKQIIVEQIIAQYEKMGISCLAGNGTDITVETEFLDAGWSTGSKKITYQASIYADETSQTVFMWEMTKEVGHGLSFGGESGSSFQSGTTLYRKVKSVQYGPEGKAYEVTLNLGAIPKAAKETAKQYGWKFKTVLKREKAMCPIENTEKSTPLQKQQYTHTEDVAYIKDSRSIHKPSKMNNIIFGVVWGLLALLSLIMLIDHFSVFRLIGVAVLMGLAIFYKTRFFTKFIKALISWVIIIILLFIVFGVTQTAEISKDMNASLEVQKANNVKIVMLAGVMPDNGKISVDKIKTPVVENFEGISFETYEIKLPTESVMEGVAEIELPYDKKQLSAGVTPEDGISASYFDEKENKWRFVPYLIDSKRGVITIMTDHFSKYAVVYFKDGRKKLSQKLPEFDSMQTSFYSESQLEGILGEIAKDENSATALNAGWNQFNTYYGLAGASGSILSEAVDSKIVNNINTLMADAGVGFMFTQLAFDIYNGDKNAAVNNLIKNAASYGASKWATSAMNLATAGATFMDIAINKYAEKALENNLQKWEDAYRHYYNTDPKAKKTAVDWYKRVAAIHKDSKNPDEFKMKLDAEIDQYCNIFWKDAEAYAYVADKTPGIRGFGAGGEYGKDVSEITARFKKYTYANTIKTVMEQYTKNLWIKESRMADAKLNKVKEEMNKEYTVTINMPDYQKIKNIKGTMVRFKNEEGRVIHSQSLDASGKAVLKMTLLGFIKANGPVKVEVVVPAQENAQEFSTTLTYKLTSTNVTLNVPYAPVQITQNPTKPSETTRAPEANNKPSDVPSPQAMQPTPIAPAPVQNVTPAPQKQEYNYAAALAAWAADFAAKQNAKTFDDGKCKTTCEFEWVKAPFIKEGQVLGASKLWYNDTYYAGPNAGTKKRYVASEMYDANNPGILISLDALKKAYPKFGN